MRRNKKEYERRLAVTQIREDICSIAIFDNENYYGGCSNTSLQGNNERNEVLGSNSFCVLSSLEKGKNTNPGVLPICYEMKCSSKSLTIKVGDHYIVCPREGGKIKAENFNGFIMCRIII